MGNEVQITKQGKAELEKELEVLIGKRGEISQRLSIARSYGDLSENAEYDAAKRDQLDLEKRIQEIRRILHNAVIISNRKRDAVSVGSMVQLIADRKTVEYQLVGSVEANPAERKISDQSPIGQALARQEGRRRGCNPSSCWRKEVQS
jgi:transcription elongation factor GreA